MMDGISDSPESKVTGILQSIWSLLFAAFFFFFFWLPDLSSLMAKVMLLLALPTWWLSRAHAAWPSSRPLLLLLPLMVYLASMTLHEFDARQLGRPAHLLFAVILFVSIRGIRLHHLWIGGGVVLSILPALALAVHEHVVLEQPRVFGRLSGGDFGNFCAALSVPLLLAMLPSGRPVAQRATLLFCSGAAALIAFWSGSRTGWLIMPVVLSCLLTAGALPGAALRRLLWAMPVLVLAVLPLAGSGMDERLQRLVFEVQAYFSADIAGYAGTSMGIRLESARLGLDLCEANPGLGLGYVEFKRIALRMAEAGLISAEIPRFFGMLHNQFLDYCMLLGIPGVLVLGVFWAGVFATAYAAVRRAPDEPARFLALCLASVMTGYFVSATGGSMFSSTKGTVYFCIALLLLLKLDAEARPSLYGRDPAVRRSLPGGVPT